MTLVPCKRCHRHVDANDARCVFCGAVEIDRRLGAEARAGSPARIAGRLCRAAIFAGAVTVASACGGSVHYESLPAAVANGEVRGHVLRHDGTPARGAFVNLYSEALRATAGRDSISVQVGPDGRFAFPDVPPGRYRIAVSGLGESPKFEVRAREAAVVKLELDKPKPVDPRQMAKPYGAPPARRRIV